MFDSDSVDNIKPVAEEKTIYIDENSVDNYILLSGSDIDDDNIEYEIQVTQAFGSLRGTPPVMLYTPDENFVGTDCFSYIVKDYWANSLPVVVEISVGEDTTPNFIVEYTVTALSAFPSPTTKL